MMIIIINLSCVLMRCDSDSDGDSDSDNDDKSFMSSDAMQ